MEEGNQGEGNSGCEAVGVKRAMWQLRKSRLQEDSDGAFTDPAQGQAGDGDTQLHGSEHFVQAAMQALYGAGADFVGIDELLNTSIAYADQRKLRCYEEGVERYQEGHCNQAQQLVGDH